MKHKYNSIVAIDPGDVRSALVEYDIEDGTIVESIYSFNHDILAWLMGRRLLNCVYDNLTPEQEEEYDKQWPPTLLAIEMIAHYGMAVGETVFRTCVWIRRFQQAWDNDFMEVMRMEEKMFLCKNPKAKDSNIRQALIDIFGPGKERAITGKACPVCKKKGWTGREHTECTQCKGSGWLYPPGPLKQITGDLWAALAVALTAVDRLKKNPEEACVQIPFPTAGTEDSSQ